MGLFRRKDERAMPAPGTPEFDAAVEGSAIPDDQSVSMGESGWASTAGANVEKSSQTIDLRGTDTAEKLREIRSIFGQMMNIPNSGGFGGGVAPPRQDPLAVVEQLAKKRDAGEITDAEFQAQKQRLLGE